MCINSIILRFLIEISYFSLQKSSEVGICCFIQLLSHVWLHEAYHLSSIYYLSYSSILLCISKIYFTKWLPCPSLSPGVCSNSCPLSQWCHPSISSSASLFTFAFNFPESGSFPMSQLFTPGDQRIAASASASVLPMNIQGWFPLGFTIWSLLKWEGLSKVFSSTTVWKHQFFGAQPSLQSNSHITHDYWKRHSLSIGTLVGKVPSLLFNMLCRFVIAFLSRSMHVLISRLQSPSELISELKEIKSVSDSTFPPPICHEMLGLDPMIFVF